VNQGGSASLFSWCINKILADVFVVFEVKHA